MTIYLIHGSKPLVAKVFYDFKQVKKAILLKFNYRVYGRYLILLVYDDRMHEWKDLDGMLEKDQNLFEQIKYDLRNIMKEAVDQIQS